MSIFYGFRLEQRRYPWDPQVLVLQPLKYSSFTSFSSSSSLPFFACSLHVMGVSSLYISCAIISAFVLIGSPFSFYLLLPCRSGSVLRADAWICGAQFCVDRGPPGLQHPPWWLMCHYHMDRGLSSSTRLDQHSSLSKFRILKAKYFVDNVFTTHRRLKYVASKTGLLLLTLLKFLLFGPYSWYNVL